MKKILEFLKTDLKIFNNYFLIAIIFTILIFVGFGSYALFTYEDTSDNLITIVSGVEGRTCTSGYSYTSPGSNYYASGLGITSAQMQSTTNPAGDGITIISTQTMYRTRTSTQSYTDWSGWTATSCDTTNTDLCKSATVYQTRSSSAVGGRYTNNYCPSSTYGYFQDKSDEGIMCTWKRFKRCCAPSSGNCNANCTYNTTGNTTCNYTATVYCASSAGSSTGGNYTLTMNTYVSSASGWETTPTYLSGTSCGTKSGYVLDSSAPIYKCYNYGAYGSYSEGTCSSTACVNGYGTCCNQTVGYSTRVINTTYSDWSNWTTTSCDTSNSNTCESATIYTYTQTLYKWCSVQSSYAYVTTSGYEWQAPLSGYYNIQLIGAKGGTNYSSVVGGAGGKTTGYVYLKKGEYLYFFVGQAGTGSSTTAANAGGYNGGGSGGSRGNSSYYSAAGGGGATDVRCFYNSTTQLCEQNTSNLTVADALGLKSRIMVAAGGGGASYHGNRSNSGGAGGGLIGNSGATAYYIYNGTTTYNQLGANQNSGASFGVGGNGRNGNSSWSWGESGAGGGGGGYYGGRGSTLTNYGVGSGSGGSSFISGYAGVNAIDSTGTHTNNTMHYSGKYFIDGDITTGYNSSGNGSASINYIGIVAPSKTTTNLNNVRYIKDCTDTNSSNSYNHWVELQAIANGENIALNTTVFGTSNEVNNTTYAYANVVDGQISNITGNSGFAYIGTAGLGCLTVDLGINPDSDDGLWDLDEVVIWHYYPDGRTYYYNTLSIGPINQTGTTTLSQVLINNDSITAETSKGKRISAY